MPTDALSMPGDDFDVPPLGGAWPVENADFGTSPLTAFGLTLWKTGSVQA